MKMAMHVLRVVLHAVFETKLIIEDVTAYVYHAVQPWFGHRQRPVYPYIFRFRVYVLRALGMAEDHVIHVGDEIKIYLE